MTYCRKRARSSLLNDRSTFQNHWISLSALLKFVYSVLFCGPNSRQAHARVYVFSRDGCEKRRERERTRGMEPAPAPAPGGDGYYKSALNTAVRKPVVFKPAESTSRTPPTHPPTNPPRRTVTTPPTTRAFIDSTLLSKTSIFHKQAGVPPTTAHERRNATTTTANGSWSSRSDPSRPNSYATNTAVSCNLRQGCGARQQRRRAFCIVFCTVL